MTPLEAYTQAVEKNQLKKDSAQAEAMQLLQTIYHDLIVKQKKWRLFAIKKPKGLYLWGEVGGGKTCLMDFFYHNLPVTKLRLHFYAFMQKIHQQLALAQGQTDPLKKIAKNLARAYQVICLDEFLVHEIADALILSELLQNLFKQGVVIVTTSNLSPDDLYKNGLQRKLFLPAIQQIKQHLILFELKSALDYRINPLSHPTHSFDWPILTLNKIQAEHFFKELNQGQTIYYEELRLHGRLIHHYGYTDHAIWFDFKALCSIPRSQLDFLTLAQRFSIILVTSFQPLHADDDNRARLLMQLVDICYDQGVKLILSSETHHANIYAAGRFMFEFQRTKSRLHEIYEKQIAKKG